jgi:uncharacterized protein (TIGR03435 family)
MTHVRLVCVLALASLAASAQSPAARPEFEVASVKASPPTPPQQVEVGVHIDGAQFHITYFTLKDYIRIAYRVKLEQVSGPEWMSSERYDVSAKIPDGAARDKVPEMLQALLEERFGLKAHREQKEFAVYALSVANGGARLKESVVDPAVAGGAVNGGGSGSANGVTVNTGRGGYFSLANNRVEARTISMPDFAETLSRFMDKPVVDMTSLPGTYDMTIELTPEDYRALLIQAGVKNGVTLPPEVLRLMEGATFDSLMAGLRSFGIRFDPRRAPMEVVVVDQVNKTPGAN